MGNNAEAVSRSIFTEDAGRVRRNGRFSPRPCRTDGGRTLKQCGKCNIFKDIEYNFYQNRRKRANGYIYSADNICKGCRKAASKAYRDKLKAEGKLKDKQKQWRADCDREKLRKTQREYARMWTLLTGRVKNPRGSYIDKREREQETLVLRQPLDEFLDELGMTHRELEVLTGIDESIFRKSRKWVSLSIVDLIFTSLGMPDQVAVLWPVDESSLHKRVA